MSQSGQLYESSRVWNQDMQQGQRNLLSALIDFFPDDVSTVLDVGCGDGKITRPLIAATGRHFIGLDASREALSRCGFETILGDATALGFADRSVDLVMTTDMLEHLDADLETRAWSELFRVAARQVMIAVPFREELLDGTTRCPACGNAYHVNWHQRAYDWPQLARRTPPGWRLEAAVLTGEPWSPCHPLETRVRRELLDEWSGWDQAVCPRCQAAGALATQPAPLPALLAAALGTQIYDAILANGHCRTHSEILLLFRRDGLQGRSLPVQRAGIAVSGQTPERAVVTCDAAQTNLHPYPPVARVVAGVDGGLIVQCPCFGDSPRLTVQWQDDDRRTLPIVVEDGLGVVLSAEFAPPSDGRLTVDLPRRIVPGYYGVLVRLPSADGLAAVELGSAGPGLFVAPAANGSPGYYLCAADPVHVYVQVEGPTWIQPDYLMAPSQGQAPRTWRDLFDRIDQVAALERQTLQAACNRLAAEQAHLRADRTEVESAYNQLASRVEVRMAVRLRKSLTAFSSALRRDGER